MADHTFTAAEKARAAKREVGMRRRVYPRWVEMNRLTREDAEREIAVMEAIQADYEAQVAAEKPDLFAEARHVG